MTRRIQPLIIICLCAAIGMPFEGQAQAPLQPFLGNGPYHRPQRMENLGYLTPNLYNKGLTPEQWTEVLLSWLVEERNNSTPSFTGGGGGTIDSGYIQAQIIKTLGDAASPRVLDILASSPELKSEGIRDALHLALGRMGDQRQVTASVTILTNSEEPWLRALAAENLQDLGAVQAVPFLKQALHDDANVGAGSSLRGSYLSYPVREAAQQALRALGFQKVVLDARVRSQKFARLLGDERKSIVLSHSVVNRNCR